MITVRLTFLSDVIKYETAADCISVKITSDLFVFDVFDENGFTRSLNVSYEKYSRLTQNMNKLLKLEGTRSRFRTHAED